VTIAVTGATGFVGQSLLDEAAQQGLQIRALTRREQPSRPNEGDGGVEWVRGDLADQAALNRLVEGADAVIHVAGVVNALDPEGFEAGNVAGTLNVVEAALAARVPRFVHVSSLAAREPHLSTYGASKRRAEKIVAASGLDWTMIRPPAVYGPRDTEIFELFRAAKWGVVPMPKTGRSSLIHAEDLARLLLALVPEGEDVRSEIFEPEDTAEDGWLHRELAQAIGEAVGRRVLVPQFSKQALMRFAALDRALRRNKAKLTPDRVNYMTHPDWVCSKAKKPPKQRWAPRIDTREGLKATAEWYRKEGWL
jgi:nucleoside-diphosphate-sugar epimerase